MPLFTALSRRTALALCALALTSLGLARDGHDEMAAAPAAGAKTVTVVLETSLGNIVVDLDAEHAPRTTANFVQYVKEKFYTDTVFHRVIPGFMIQGGGFTADLKEKPTHPPIAIESDNGLKNVRGTIAMARTRDPNSATAQFFINVVDNGMLDFPGRDHAGYTVFGRVSSGLEVADQIVAVPTKNVGMYQNVPVTPVVIKSVRIKE